MGHTEETQALDELPGVREHVEALEQLVRLRTLYALVDLACHGHEDDIDCEVVDDIKERLGEEMRGCEVGMTTQRSAAIDTVRAWLIGGAK